jgi:hypothetical protein
MKVLKEFGSHQKIYQLDFKVYKTKNYTISEIFKVNPIRLKDGYVLDEDLSECIDKVCVSDAHTHHERLVFPAFYVKNNERILTFRCNAIDGQLTMMTQGGNISSMRKPEIYIRHLRMLNREYNQSINDSRKAKEASNE